MQPFIVEPVCHERVWGGRRIATRLGRTCPEGPIGESWEIHGDLLVRGQNRRLNELCGVELLGYEASAFPLLCKWLDCREWLSIQVHPDDATAQRLTGDPRACGKYEGWYFVEVDEGAEVIHGFVGEPRIVDGEEWLQVLRRVKPSVGQWLSTPSGTVHALGPGLLLYEVQQSCDLTYRLWDWGRDRPVHIEEGREAILCSRSAEDNPYFRVECMEGPCEWEPARLEVVAFPFGRGKVGDLVSDLGGSVIIPACAGRVSVDCQDRWLRIVS